MQAISAKVRCATGIGHGCVSNLGAHLAASGGAPSGWGQRRGINDLLPAAKGTPYAPAT
jgi:hypothetical protein